LQLSSTRRLSDLALSRPVAFGIALIIIWWAVMLLLASALPRLSLSWFPDLSMTLVNIGALLVPLAVVTAFGWWRQAGLALPRPDRSWWTLLPLLAFALSFAAGGLSGSPAQFFSSAILFLALGLNEELLYRGVIQHATNTLGALPLGGMGGVAFRLPARWHRDLLWALALRYGSDGDFRNLLRGGVCSGAVAHRHDLAVGVPAWARELLQYP
jgi:hypothetical protein